MEKVVVILGTARDLSNTARAFEDHLPYKDFTLVELHKLIIKNYSYEPNKAQDDFLFVVNQMIDADVIVFATPVYWYAMSGWMKVFLDRFTDLISTHKHLGKALKGKSTYLFCVGNDEHLPDGFAVPFERTSEYFEMDFKGMTYVCVKN